MALAGRVVELVQRLHKAHGGAHAIVRVDTTGGHGAGPADSLRETLHQLDWCRVIDVNSSETADDQERYINRRSELWFAAADRGREGRLDLSRIDRRAYDVLVAQLTAPKYKYDSQGRRVVEPKEETKKRLQRSPDDADAFNLAYAGKGKGQASVPVDELAQKSRHGIERLPQRETEDIDVGGSRWKSWS
jgi:hypothetical protein